MSHKCEHGKDSDVCVRCAEESHDRPRGAKTADLGRGAGRPPIDGARATGQIQARTTLARKNAYVRAAKPKSLTVWMFEILDKAANYNPDLTLKLAHAAAGGPCYHGQPLAPQERSDSGPDHQRGRVRG
jgi:hypothetical protein